MAEQVKSSVAFPTANELMQKIAQKEAEKATEQMQAIAKAEAEKKRLLDNMARPSGVSDEERLERAAVIINRAVANGLTEVLVAKFPNVLCTDRGRAINNLEPGYETTLTGLPRELYDFWDKHLRPKGYRLRVEIVDFPDGIPGDFGMTLQWG
jgi:hypothetical protein